MAKTEKATKKVVKKSVKKSVKKAAKKVSTKAAKTEKKESKEPKGYQPRWNPESPANVKVPDRIQRATIPELGGERCIYLKSSRTTDKEGWRKANVSLSGQTIPGFARQKKDGQWEWKRRKDLTENAQKAWENRVEEMAKAVEEAVATTKKKAVKKTSRAA
jgi:hypothetical protein